MMLLSSRNVRRLCLMAQRPRCRSPSLMPLCERFLNVRGFSSCFLSTLVHTELPSRMRINKWPCRLLRARRQRPRSRSPEKRDELTPPHIRTQAQGTELSHCTAKCLSWPHGDTAIDGHHQSGGRVRSQATRASRSEFVILAYQWKAIGGLRARPSLRMPYVMAR
jgi:hypothetical protein